MSNKIQAATTRAEIRDFFDIDFMLRNGIPMPASDAQKASMLKILSGFKSTDYSVTLGSLLDAETRRYYAKNGLKFLSDKLIPSQ